MGEIYDLSPWAFDRCFENALESGMVVSKVKQRKFVDKNSTFICNQAEYLGAASQQERVTGRI